MFDYIKKALARDANGKAIQVLIPEIALATTNIIALTTHLLNTGTSILELYSPTEDVVIKWGTVAITTTNFDAIIPVGQIRHLVIPQNVTNIMLAKYADATLPTKITVIEF